jgi:hypothetical protein
MIEQDAHWLLCTWRIRFYRCAITCGMRGTSRGSVPSDPLTQEGQRVIPEEDPPFADPCARQFASSRVLGNRLRFRAEQRGYAVQV